MGTAYRFRVALDIGVYGLLVDGCMGFVYVCIMPQTMLTFLADA